MASITTSPIHAPIMVTAIAGGNWSSKKRRPVDPEETGSVATAPYYVEQPNAKRPRTIDDVLESMSLRQPDPPGNSFCWKRKSDVEVEDGRSVKVARSVIASAFSSTLNESKIYGEGNSPTSQQLDPTGRKGAGGSPTNVTSEMTNSNIQKSQQKEVATNSAPDNQKMAHAKSASTNMDSTNMDGNDMAIDDSDHESDSSVSEGSIRNAMYQLVFGRRNPPPYINCSSYGRYDAVDSKIEDIIRRSRMEAVIKSQKKENDAESATEMDMDGDITDG